jgi:Zn-dependent protease
MPDVDFQKLALFVGVIGFSVILHEVAHGYVALLRGDPTAQSQGRLTLNPISHIDPFGTIILPILMYLTVNMAFGWARPVPVNPYALKRPRWDLMLVAAAGPATNIAIAVFFGLLLRALPIEQTLLGDVARVACTLNLFLAFLNLLPIPPLDGSKITTSLFPGTLGVLNRQLAGYGFLIVILLSYFGALDFLGDLTRAGTRLLLGR